MEYDLINQLLQVGQPQPAGYGGLAPQAAPKIEIQRKTKQPMQPQLAEPIVAAFSPRPKFPTSAEEFNALIQRQTEGLAGQREGLKQLESQISELSKPQQASMLPGILMAASDLMAGTQFMKGYQTPEQKAQMQKEKALALQMQMQKAKGDLTDKEIDLFKAQYQDALGRERLAQEENMLKMKLGADAAKEAGKTPDLKDWQVQSATYGKRLSQAENVFNDLENQGYDRGTFGEGAKDLLSGVPGVGHLTSENLKRQQQAERNFVTATLRKESGAAISKSEFANAEQQYFPRAGDTPEVLAQKRANRQQVIEGMKLGAGPAWEQLPQVQSEIGRGTVMGSPKKVMTKEEWIKAGRPKQ